MTYYSQNYAGIIGSGLNYALNMPIVMAIYSLTHEHIELPSQYS